MEQFDGFPSPERTASPRQGIGELRIMNFELRIMIR